MSNYRQEELDPKLHGNREPQNLCKLHNGEKNVYDWITTFSGHQQIEIPDINFFF